MFLAPGSGPDAEKSGGGVVSESFARPFAGDAGGARDRESYFAAAYCLLSEGGCEAVTIAALTGRLRVTKGSFYHHFADMPGFVWAFAAHWQQWWEGRLAGYAAIDDPHRRLEVIQNSHHDLMVGAEPAIRAWARNHPVLAATLARLHEAGEPISRTTFTEICGDEDLARVLNRAVVSMLLGVQLRMDPIDPDRFLVLVVEVTRRLLGVTSDAARIDGRLRSRVHATQCHRFPIDPAWQRPRLPETQPPRQAAGPDPAPPGRGRRGPESWFAAALALYTEYGFEAVTVAALCERLAVTKGSFHHHFPNMPAFVTALTGQWETAAHARHDRLQADPDPLGRLATILQPLLAEPSTAHSAWRAWAHTEPVIGRAVRRVDDHQQQVIFGTLAELNCEPAAADLLAEMTVDLAIGLQQPRTDTDRHETAWTVLEWTRRVLRVPAELRLDRDRLLIALGKPL
jgi:AcrR family transcriptional regulator